MIAIFGAAGQLAQELAERARIIGMPFLLFDRKDVDIADADAVRNALTRTSPSVVVNAAAYTNVDRAESDITQARHTNADGPGVLAKETSIADINLIHVSTDYVFNGTKQGAYTEKDPVSPLGVYGRTKSEGEVAVRAAQPRHVILRTSWVFGTYGHNILKTILRLASERNELRFVADQRGCPTSTIDLAEAILSVANRIRTDTTTFGTYHFAGTGVTTWHGFAERVVAAQAPITGRRPIVTPITTAQYRTPAERPPNSELDSTLFANIFGLRAEPWEQRVDGTVARLLSRENAS